MNNLVLGVDFETSGLNPDTDVIIESACVLWDWEATVPLVMHSSFIHQPIELSPEIVKLTGITNQMLEDYAMQEVDVFSNLTYLMNRAQYVMAHFGNKFDRKFYEATCKRHSYQMSERQWLDSSIDIVYDEAITTRNLRHLAAEHHFVAPFGHRALFDVLTMLKVASHYDLASIVARANEPTVHVQALVSFDEKEKAKERGYRWFAPQKIWWKSAKLSDFERERGSYPFKAKLLDGAPE